VDEYKLQKELIRVISVCDQLTAIPEKFKKIQNLAADEEAEELLELFMAPPNSSGLFSYKAINDKKLDFVLNKVFSKRNILIHNQDKLTFSKCIKHFSTLFIKHLAGAAKKNKGFKIASLKSKYMKKKAKTDAF
jgi:hypothetical protein